MGKSLAGILIFLVLTSAAQARSLSGQWQGIIQGAALRIVVKIGKAPDGHATVALYSIDQGPEAIMADSVTIDGNKFDFAIGQLHLKYEGEVDGSGNAITGTITQGAPTSLDLQRTDARTAWPIDASPHAVHFITVAKGVKLEVLDWGGTGRPLILLSGLGATAHAFDELAPRFTATHHVYAITRRGFGNSTAPDPATSDYSADRLGADVIAVIDALKLERPILAGHSIAGEELSAVAAQAPQKVAGLIYMDAGYAYGFYAPGALVPEGASLTMDFRPLQQDIRKLYGDPTASDLDLIQTHLGELQQDIATLQAFLKTVPPSKEPPRTETRREQISDAILAGVERYTSIPVPVLAFFALDPKIPATTPADQKLSIQAQAAQQAHQADLFEAGVPTAHVVRLPGAAHAIWTTNEDEVVRDMEDFMGTLK